MADARETAGLAPGHKLYIFFSIQGPLEEFRLPEIESVAQLYNIPFSWPAKPDYTVRTRPSNSCASALTQLLRRAQRPYMLIGLPDDEAARKLGSRLVSVKHVWEFWATAETYEELHERVKSAECREKWVRSTVSRRVCAVFVSRLISA